MLSKIISGGQTGVDRAALDVAIDFEIDHFGWCPRGRRAEDGLISHKYLLKETISECYEERTLFNIRDSDATLILVAFGTSFMSISNGTKLTVEELKNSSKPYLIIEISNNDTNDLKVNSVIEWLNKHNIQVLNIAGPRESTSPGIYNISYQFLTQLLVNYKSNQTNHFNLKPFQ